MFTKPLVTAAALIAALGSSAAFAQEATPDTWTQIVSSTSRADVRADAAEALRAGLIERGEASVSTVAFMSVKSRAQVRAEAVEARRLGLSDRGEASGPSATPAQAELIRQAGLRAIGTPLAQAVR